jgi:hypothetical protein
LKKLGLTIGVVVAALIIFVGVMYFVSDGVASEFRQIRQPAPNLFYIAIDVSATIEPATLFDFKYNLVSRLRQFIGEEAVSYHVVTFGNPGCGMESVQEVVSTRSPPDETAFTYEVENEIREISVPEIDPTSTKPLTTPLHALLKTVLPQRKGGRFIFFSDLLNEDSDCPRQHPFPEAALKAFGEDKTGQLIFLYTTPHPSKEEKQQAFIQRMREMANRGEIRAFFYHVPDDPEDRSSFMESQLEKSIPATTYEVVMERASRMVDSIVTAVRG